MEITFNIPQGQELRLYTAILTLFGDPENEPETQQDKYNFVKSEIAKLVIRTVRRHEPRTASREAEGNVSDIDLT